MRNFDTRASIKYQIFPTRDPYSYKRDDHYVADNIEPKCCWGGELCLKMLILITLLIPVVFIATRHFYPKIKALNEEKLSVTIQNFRPYQNDQYICVSHHLDEDQSYYVTKYSTLDPNAAAHHMLLYACEKPVFEHGKIWRCGHVSPAEDKKRLPIATQCGAGESEVIFAEAMQAGAYELPNNVSFKLGQGTKYKYLTLQIHYATTNKFDKDPNLTDNSGLQLSLAKEATKFNAHTMLIANGGGLISKDDDVTNLDILCKIMAPNEKITMKPFAFRTHAHSLGQVISGYTISTKNKTDWKLIARKSPQLRQTFYPILRDDSIENMQEIAVRCSYKNPTGKHNHHKNNNIRIKLLEIFRKVNAMARCKVYSQKKTSKLNVVKKEKIVT